MLKISALTSSGNDGNVETNVLDGNLATRWSCQGAGSWLQADLGGIFTLTEVDIAWYKGQGRINNFQITTSTDNLSFQPAFTGSSSGTTAALEKYPVSANARYVRITINGNNQNQWASITELEIMGGGSPSPGPVPIPPPGTRQQVRQTTTGGDPVPDVDWKVVTDTGPLPVIPPPGVMTVQNETLSVLENTPLQIVLSATDTNANATITFENTQPTNGKVTAGTQPVAANQISLVYTPNQGFSGTDSFMYSATDDKGASSNSGTVTITVSGTPPPPLQVDQFGIQKIYADAAPPVNNWVFNGTISDPRFMEQRIVSAGNGWFAPSNQTEFRLEIKSDTITDASIPTFHFQEVIKKGYLYKPVNSPDGKGDWGAIEQTWRFKVIKPGTGTTNGEAHVELVPGGYAQNSSLTKIGNPAVPIACEAWSYHFNLYPLTGRRKFEKDSMHTPGYTVNSSDPQITDSTVGKFDNGQEVIQKAILYPIPNTSVPTGGPAMKLESWLDMTGTGAKFIKVLEKVDDGKWGPTQGGNGACCSNDSQYQYVVLNAARVAIGFRCDNMVNFQFKDMSIRSIDPTRPLQAKEEHEKVIHMDGSFTDDDKIYQHRATDENKKEEDKELTEEEKKALLKAKEDAELVRQHAASPKIKQQAAEVAEKASDVIEEKIGFSENVAASTIDFKDPPFTFKPNEIKDDNKQNKKTNNTKDKDALG